MLQTLLDSIGLHFATKGYEISHPRTDPNIISLTIEHPHHKNRFITLFPIDTQNPTLIDLVATNTNRVLDTYHTTDIDLNDPKSIQAIEEFVHKHLPT